MITQLNWINTEYTGYTATERYYLHKDRFIARLLFYLGVPGNWLFLLYTPKVVSHWCSGLVCLSRVSIQSVEVVVWFTVFYIYIKVTCPVNHNTNGPSLSRHKSTIRHLGVLLHEEQKRQNDNRQKMNRDRNALYHLHMTPVRSDLSKQKQTYHLGYCFKTEARQFNYVSHSEYGTQWVFHWIIKTFTDVIAINALNQVTPENTIKHH